MKKILYFTFFLIFINRFLFSQSLPELTGRIVDIAGILTEEQKTDLENILKSYEEKTQHQMVVAIINSLEGYPIEEYSIKLAEKWKIGRKDFDDGVILLVSIGDRKVRIEVGYGLESQLTDAESFLIIERIIKPAFKNGDFYGGLKSAILEIGKETGMEDSSINTNNYTTRKYSDYSKRKKSHSKNAFFWAILAGFIFAVIIKIFFNFMKNLGKVGSFFGFLLSLIISIIVSLIVAGILESLVLFFISSFIFALFILSSKRTDGVDIGSTTYTDYGGGSIFGSWGDSSSSSWGDSSGGFDGFSGGGGDFGGGGASGDW